MANSDKNILITPSVGLSTNPTIKFNGANNTPTTLRVLDDGTVSFEGTAGQLFSISDGLTGSIFSVNDISGIPSIEVLDTGLVKLNQYGGSAVFGSSAAIQNASSVNAKVSISTASATTPGLIIKGVSSQSANLQEWQDSVGTVKAFVRSDGFIRADASLQTPTIYGPSVTNGTQANIATAWTFLTNVATNTGIIVKGAASQTANLQEWQNSAGTVLAAVSSIGTIRSSIFANLTGGLTYIATNFDTAGIGIVTSSAAQKGLIIRGSASQTADLQQWQDSSGTALLRVNSAGQIQAPQPASKGLVVKAATTLTATITNAVGSGTTVTYTAANTFTAGQKVTITGIDPVAYNLTSVTIATASATDFTVTNAATGTYVSGGTATVSQSANLQEWQNSSGTVLSRVTENGQAMFPVYWDSRTQGTNAGIALQAASASTIVSIFKGSASQTANLTQWQDSGGNVLTRVQADGTISWGTGGSALQNSTGRLVVNPSSASAIAVIVKGATSQTADLQQWRQSNDVIGTKIGPYGELVGSNTLANSIGPTISGVMWGVTASLASYVPSVIRGATSQTANLQEWQNDAGTVLARIRENGSLNLIDGAAIITLGNNSGAQLSSAYLSVTCYPTNPGIVIRGGASQSGNLQEWQNSAGTALVKVAADGHLIVGSFNNSGWISVNPDGAARIPIRITLAASQTADSIRIDNSSNAALFRINNAGQIQPPLSASIGLVVKGLDSQTGDLQQWQDSSGTILTKIMSNGSLFVNSTGTSNDPITIQRASATRFKVDPYGNVFAIALTAGDVVNAISGTTAGIYTGTASNIGLVIKGSVSQTANLQEWQDSSGNILVRIASSGHLNTNAPVNVNGFPAGLTFFGVKGDDGTVTTSIIRGATSQTANLQEWQDSSGTILGGMQSNGQLFGTQIKTKNAYVFIGEQNSGGSTIYTRQTATPSAPGANAANLYFRDGTNAGTLKLVVRAGASGAETTILDNIPQS